MNLRWLERKYPMPSREAIRAYQDAHACGPTAAKQALKTPDEKVLQMFDGKDWVDVPTVTQMMPEDPKNTL